jgi:uncharacterized damage-inducible protein DinB
MAEALAAAQIFQLTTLNDEFIGSLDWVTNEAWTRRPGPGEWSAAEIVGHVIELEPYWASEALRLAENPGCEVGRQLDDARRLAGPESGMTLDAKDARTRIARSGEQAVELLRRIPDSAWSMTGKWRGQDVTLADLLQRHLIEHLRDHLEQATAALDAG